MLFLDQFAFEGVAHFFGPFFFAHAFCNASEHFCAVSQFCNYVCSPTVSVFDFSRVFVVRVASILSVLCVVV